MLYKLNPESRSTGRVYLPNVPLPRDNALNLLTARRYYSTFINKSINNLITTRETSTMTGIISRPYSDKLSWYLAGLIEADCTIIVPKTKRSPKGRLYYPSIQILFDSRDMGLALIIQRTLGHVKCILGYVFIIFLVFICKDFSWVFNNSILLAFVPAVVYANADTQKNKLY